jgi:hypothetical protein
LRPPNRRFLVQSSFRFSQQLPHIHGFHPGFADGSQPQVGIFVSATTGGRHLEAPGCFQENSDIQGGDPGLQIIRHQGLDDAVQVALEENGQIVEG